MTRIFRANNNWTLFEVSLIEVKRKIIIYGDTSGSRFLRSQVLYFANEFNERTPQTQRLILTGIIFCCCCILFGICTST